MNIENPYQSPVAISEPQVDQLGPARLFARMFVAVLPLALVFVGTFSQELNLPQPELAKRVMFFGAGVAVIQTLGTYLSVAILQLIDRHN